MDSKLSGTMLTEQAETYDRCMEKIRTKFGSNFQIMLRKTIRLGGFLGFFEKEGVELSFIPTKIPTKMYETSVQKPIDYEEERKKILAANPVKINPQIQQVLEEVRSLKEQLATAPIGARADEHDTIVRLEKLLESNEFTSSYMRSILDRIRKTFSLEELDDFESVQQKVVEWIGESIKIALPPAYARPHVIILVGPTGVGKTTTVAKFAASFISPQPNSFTSHPMNVRLITIDNFRIGGQQQLEAYANIMEVPVSLAETVDDIKKLLAMYREDVDIVIIDTIGCSPKDYSKIADMRKMLDQIGSASDVYLTFSASTKPSDLRSIMRQFEVFGYESIIVTKLDETSMIGSLISVLDEKNKSVAYVTTGQRVPVDIERASQIKFLTLLTDFKINRAKIEQYFEQKNTE